MREDAMVRHTAAEMELTQVKAAEVVHAIFETMKDALQQGDSVILRRFGSFQVRDKRARIGRNPKTGEEAAIPARRVVRFKAGNELKDVVHEAAAELTKSPI